MELMVRSHLDEVVRIAARYDVTDLYSEDVSLEDVFLGYYGISNNTDVNNGAEAGRLVPSTAPAAAAEGLSEHDGQHVA